jgi:HSP20 family molecular chaperone IbpA
VGFLKKLLGTTDAMEEARAEAEKESSAQVSTSQQLPAGWNSPEVTQTDDEVVLKMDAPGLDPDSVETETDGSAVVVKAHGTNDAGAKINLNERFAVKGADLSQARVSYEDGKFVVRIPKSAFPAQSSA